MGSNVTQRLNVCHFNIRDPEMVKPTRLKNKSKNIKVWEICITAANELWISPLFGCIENLANTFAFTQKRENSNMNNKYICIYINNNVCFLIVCNTTDMSCMSM